MQYLFELSGELGDMPRDEVRAAAAAESDGAARVVAGGPGYLVMDMPEEAFVPTAGRLALTHGAGPWLGSYSPEDVSGLAGVVLPEGTFAVRAKRFEGMMREVDSQDLVRRAGTLLSSNNRVDLKAPDFTVRMVLSDRVHVYVEQMEAIPTKFDERKVSERPFFSPISLHPKYARALINLTGVKRGGTVLDPFCGTGGIAIEAATMGLKPIVSDFDPEMVAGTRENMEYFGLDLEDFDVLDISDIPDRFRGVDAIVCDPPYGRSTKTGGEGVDSIYARAFEAFPKTVRAGGMVGVCLPHVCDPPQMRLEALYTQYVHGTLTRYYHVFAPRVRDII